MYSPLSSEITYCRAEAVLNFLAFYKKSTALFSHELMFKSTKSVQSQGLNFGFVSFDRRHLFQRYKSTLAFITSKFDLQKRKLVCRLKRY